MFLIDGRMPEQVCCGRRRDRHDAVLAVDETAADINRRAEETLNPKCVEANRCSNSVNDGINGSDFVEFDIRRLDVMHFAFRYRQFREYVRRETLRSRSEIAVANHR